MKKIVIIMLCFIYMGAINAGDYIVFDKNFKVKPGGKLIVDLNPGSVVIKTWDKDEFEISTRNLTEDREKYLSIKNNNNTIYVEYDEHWGWNDEVKIMINIPKKFNVEINSTGGSVSLYNDLDGNIKVESSGGEISLRDVTGDTGIKTAGGDIKTGDIGGKLNANTFGGNILLGSISGSSALVKTMGGNIDVYDVKSDIELETLGGDIDVGNVEGNLIAQTAGGDIKIKTVKGSVKMETSGGNLRLNGANGKVFAETSGGDILLTNIKGEVDVNTSAGEIDIELNPEPSKSSFINSSYGDVTLRLPENSDVEVECSIRINEHWGYTSNSYSINSEYKNIKIKKNKNRKEIEGNLILNKGSHKIKVKTNNSEIYIKKLK